VEELDRDGERDRGPDPGQAARLRHLKITPRESAWEQPIRLEADLADGGYVVGDLGSTTT
jgi:hypothetical protein